MVSFFGGALLDGFLEGGDWWLMINRCGKQGFQQKPDKPFIVNGMEAGTWGYEVRFPPFKSKPRPVFRFHPFYTSPPLGTT